MSLDSSSPLLRTIDGDVDFSEQTRLLYATDASIYRETPAGVIAPRSTTDVCQIVEYARKMETSITPRGAGSSLTGNAIGAGIVVDFERYFDNIVDVNPDGRTVTVQPGVVLDNLNAHLKEYGLYFPPDPSTSGTCTIGGMVANDAAGAHSVRHGTTRDNVQSVECVLADGTVERFERLSSDDVASKCDRDDRVGEIYRTVRDIGIEYVDEIDARYPDVDRNSSGYDLDTAIGQDGSWVDLSKLITGSEGTLAAITEVTLEVAERPETRIAALVFYEDIITAADAVPGVLEADPSVVELIDDAVLGYAREAWGIDLVPQNTGAALLIEAETTAELQETRLEELVSAATTESTVSVERAINDAAQNDIWKIRKASNPLLNRQPGDEQALSFIEDAAVPPEQLAEYLDRVGEILAAHDLRASVFGHAGQGVLHIKPFLNLKTQQDRNKLRSVSEQVHDLVLDVGGCVSGEHGDGRLRSTYLESMYGEDLYAAFIQLKRAFDPDDVFNPAKVVPTQDGSLAEVDDELRYDNYSPEPIDTALSFDEENGFSSLVEQCNGCSKCRTTDAGVMCPSYRAVEAESTTTRGRANMLREALNGTLGEDAITSDWFQEEVLELCLSCKACERECPTGTDISKLKTEVKHQKHQKSGVPLRSQLFGNVRTLNRLGSLFTPVSNWLADSRPARWLMEKALGIDQRRELPEFASESLEAWFQSYTPSNQSNENGEVILFADCYTNYNHPEVGQAAVEILDYCGYTVELLETACCGRPALSQGMVEKARADAETNVERLGDRVAEDVPILSVEPSCVSALEEYSDLVDDPRGIPTVARTVVEFLHQEGALTQVDFTPTGERVAVHGHCHSKARGRDQAPLELLRTAAFEVEPVESTCCGMAGAFGYEAEHYDLSVSLGDELATKLDAIDADHVVTTGASCSQQVAERYAQSTHPLVLLADCLER
ncbi:FAD/FMN-containing dehydrogenase [Halogranum amylolyticum]|uniref:FAD/FMN-containing dehydrogenase n=1 Tax=Halogranum amylolyticum TaxID=660520 RepID=A0A1H8WA43_9EURY|nr:FAD-binding and (Fe-S)-binding domain-containing protein [Halogranum amylolyticum]SEP24499.1 FAD/FMN-containing dehydrogenase [Halogranum amylolyticum]